MKASLMGSSFRRERQRWRRQLRYRGTKSGRWREQSPPKALLPMSPAHFAKSEDEKRDRRDRPYRLGDHNRFWVCNQHLGD